MPDDSPRSASHTRGQPQPPSSRAEQRLRVRLIDEANVPVTRVVVALGAPPDSGFAFPEFGYRPDNAGWIHGPMPSPAPPGRYTLTAYPQHGAPVTRHFTVFSDQPPVVDVVLP